MVGKQPEACALCGLPIDAAPVVQSFDGIEEHFCCQGCARVYQLAHDNGMLDQVLPHDAPRSPGLKQSVLSPGKTAHFSLGGMWCAGCSTAAEQILRRQPGIKAADVSLAAEQGRIQYDPELADPQAVLRKLDALGYRAQLLTQPGEQQGERRQEHTLWQLLTAAGFGMQIMFLYLEILYPAYAAGRFGHHRDRTRPVRRLGARHADPALRRQLVSARRVAGAAGTHRDDGHARRARDAIRLRLQAPTSR